jgi:hypothetical protein
MREFAGMLERRSSFLLDQYGNIAENKGALWRKPR